MTVFLKGLKLGGFKGIGKAQEMALFGHFNFFAGANNSGKSTVLEFLDQFGGDLTSIETRPVNLDRVDRHIGTTETNLQIAFGLPAEDVEHTLKELIHKIKDISVAVGADTFLSPFDFRNGKRNIWFTPQLLGQNDFRFFVDFDVPALAQTLNPSVWQMLWNHLTLRSGGGLENHWIPEILEIFDRQFTFSLPEIHLLPSIRQIGKSGQEFKGLGGQGLIDKLQTLQNPPPLEQEAKAQFEAINKLLQTVLNKPNARLEIPHTKECIIVHVDNKSLPLESLGTGIEEIIMIGAYCTIYDSCIMCLEEPELHLHPILQRQLLQYLEAETSNQYFISTHSAAFIDMAGGQVFHVENDGASTTIRNVTERASRKLLTDRLGYRASDIVQANSIIWVEGPSDRVYLLNWLQQVDSELIEGIHFSIMFYGGRLLSHISGDDTLVDDFINLKAMNQNSAIILDSDRSEEAAKIGEHKERVIAEFSEERGFSWLTSGREIENYLDTDLLKTTIETIHSRRFGASLGMERYDNSLKYTNEDKTKDYTADKMKVAQQMSESELNLDLLDLRDQVTRLVTFIRDAKT
ncbi:MAG: AAA family ATPase [Ascidiaceihabitans sp.]|nr:AAA family ATPase [Ascidiaceihabitans sp.]